MCPASLGQIPDERSMEEHGPGKLQDVHTAACYAKRSGKPSFNAKARETKGQSSKLAQLLMTEILHDLIYSTPRPCGNIMGIYIYIQVHS